MLKSLSDYIKEQEQGIFKDFVYNLKDVIAKDNYFRLDINGKNNNYILPITDTVVTFYIQHIMKIYWKDIIFEDDLKLAVEDCFYSGFTAMYWHINNQELVDSKHIDKFMENNLLSKNKSVYDNMCTTCKINNTSIVKYTLKKYIESYALKFSQIAFKKLEELDLEMCAVSFVSILCSSFNFGSALYSTIFTKKHY